MKLRIPYSVANNVFPVPAGPAGFEINLF